MEKYVVRFMVDWRTEYIRKYSESLFGFEDFLSFFYIAWHELGKPSEWSWAVYDKGRSLIREAVFGGHSPMSTRRFEVWDDRETGNDYERSVEEKKLEEILLYYETHTATETIKAFGLPDTRRVRKLLSEAVPKPEKRTRDGKRKKIYIDIDMQYKEIMRKYGVSKATAFRAKKRGYLEIKATKNK